MDYSFLLFVADYCTTIINCLWFITVIPSSATVAINTQLKLVIKTTNTITATFILKAFNFQQEKNKLMMTVI